ncbi:hypothetical protein CDL15_Pgr024820 [Punica granatum]|uniref:Extensin-like n=1 Tax=Punica granatum TaxID=22663 RepID=A0A218WJS2_PUNGR|nr:hypothetical protein CDL15_Pgr024820 [Punica granatum]
MHAPPPLTPAGVPLAHHGAPSTHLPPPASSGTPPAYSGAPLPRVPPPAVQVPSIPDDNARIAALEGTVNQLAANMATNMAEFMALFKGPNRASSSSTPPPGYGPTVDPNPWVLPTFAQESGDAPAPTTAHIPATYLVSNLPVPPAFPQPSDAPAIAPSDQRQYQDCPWGDESEQEYPSPSCYEIVEARRGNRGITVLPPSHFFPEPPHIVDDTLDYPSSDSDNAPDALPAVCTVTEETPSGVHIRLAQENEELDNWTSVSRYSAVIADV